MDKCKAGRTKEKASLSGGTRKEDNAQKRQMMLLLLGKIRTDDAIDKMSTKLELWKNDLKLE